MSEISTIIEYQAVVQKRAVFLRSLQENRAATLREDGCLRMEVSLPDGAQHERIDRLVEKKRVIRGSGRVPLVGGCARLRRGHVYAARRVKANPIAQCADRNAERAGGVGAVAVAAGERAQDELTFDVGDLDPHGRQDFG
jgi:hypothetical protein